MGVKKELRFEVAFALFLVGVWAGMAPPLLATDWAALDSRLFVLVCGLYAVVSAFGFVHATEKHPVLGALASRLSARPYLAVFTASAAASLFGTAVACGYDALHWPIWAQAVLSTPAGLYIMCRLFVHIGRST